MRALLVALIVVGVALVVGGALAPEFFVFSLLGMLVLAGTASVGIAALMQSGPRPHY